VAFLSLRNCSLLSGAIFIPVCSQHCLLLFCVFSLIFVFCVCTFLFVVVIFPFGRLLVLYFSLVVPPICNFLLHICICFPSKINDDDDDDIHDIDSLESQECHSNFHKHIYYLLVFVMDVGARQTATR